MPSSSGTYQLMEIKSCMARLNATKNKRNYTGVRTFTKTAISKFFTASYVSIYFYRHCRSGMAFRSWRNLAAYCSTTIVHSFWYWRTSTLEYHLWLSWEHYLTSHSAKQVSTSFNSGSFGNTTMSYIVLKMETFLTQEGFSDKNHGSWINLFSDGSSQQ